MATTPVLTVEDDPPFVEGAHARRGEAGARGGCSNGRSIRNSNLSESRKNHAHHEQRDEEHVQGAFDRITRHNLAIVQERAVRFHTSDTV